MSKKKRRITILIPYVLYEQIYDEVLRRAKQKRSMKGLLSEVINEILENILRNIIFLLKISKVCYGLTLTFFSTPLVFLNVEFTNILETS